MEKNYYKDIYIPSIVKWGRIIAIFGAVAVVLPLVVLRYVFGIEVESAKLMSAVTGQLALTVVYWVTDPISAFPALGVPGTMVAFLSGNVFNMRLPCGTAALKTTNYEVGSDEASIVSTIGLCASVFINVIFLVIATFLGDFIINNVSDSFITVLSYLLPALFGSMYAMYAINDIFNGIVAVTLAVISFQLYFWGLLNWIPFDPSLGVVFIPMIGTIFLSSLYYSRKMKKDLNEGEE